MRALGVCVLLFLFLTFLSAAVILPIETRRVDCSRFVFARQCRGISAKKRWTIKSHSTDDSPPSYLLFSNGHPSIVRPVRKQWSSKTETAEVKKKELAPSVDGANSV